MNIQVYPHHANTCTVHVVYPYRANTCTVCMVCPPFTHMYVRISPSCLHQVESTHEHLIHSVAECQSLRKENVTLKSEVSSLKKKVVMLEKAVETPESKRTLCRILERYT